MKRPTTTGGLTFGDALASSLSTSPHPIPARTMPLRFLMRPMAM
ncbi:MAG: hypothetical protein M0Z80_01295 [Treponema sp.]|nr:hypothetical protein [Treponema sp.]